jgi:hypothetical protein
MKIAKIFVFSWFALAFGLSASAWFEQFPAPALFGIGAVASATGFTVLYLLEERFRSVFRALSLRHLTYGQTLRFFGSLAFVKAWQHVLPAVFAIPTGLMDVAIAGGSVFVARHLAPSKGKPPAFFTIWHVAGLGTLAVSTILAFLTASPRFGLVSGDVTSQSMASFPISLVPTFIGPLVLIFHLLALFNAHYQAHYQRSLN